MAFTTLHAGDEDFATVRHLRVEGSQREIGRALAAAAEQVHGAAARPVPAPDPVARAGPPALVRTEPSPAARPDGRRR